MKKIIYIMMSFIVATLMAMPVQAQDVIEGEVAAAGRHGSDRLHDVGFPGCRYFEAALARIGAGRYRQTLGK